MKTFHDLYIRLNGMNFDIFTQILFGDSAFQ